MKNLIYLLILFPFFGLGQSKTNDFIGTYTYRDSNSCYKLVVNEDSTFNYKQTLKYDSVSVVGKWKMNGKYMELHKYKINETIVKVEEFKTDTLKNKIIVEVALSNEHSGMGLIRGDHVVSYIDGKRVNINTDISGSKMVVTDLSVWINLNCNMTCKTNNVGRAIFNAKNIGVISFNDDNYVVQNKSNNYFVVTIHHDAIICGSSKALNWTKWILIRGNLVPVGCNKKVHDVIFKKQ